MRLISSGKITDCAEGSPLSSCTFPGICVLPDGGMIASFKGSPEKGPLAGQGGYLCYSDDAGETWSEPYDPFPGGIVFGGRAASVRGMYATHIKDGNVLLVMPAVYEDSDKPYYNTETEGLLDTDIFFAHSDDYGRTFSAPERMTTAFDQPVPLTGPVIRLPDGALVCQFELNKTYYDERPWVHSSVIIFSYDDGRSWGGDVVITKDPDIYYWDQRMGVVNGGSLLDLFWVFDRKTAEYRTIHASDSTDGGKTWSPIWDTGLTGQPGCPADLGDGRLAVIHIDRTGAPKIIVRISEDGGHTFLSEELVIYDSKLEKQEVIKSDMNAAWEEMGAFSVGHPGLAVLPSGELYAFFYAGPHTDRTDICRVKIEV